MAGYVKVDRSFDNCQCPCPFILSLRGASYDQFSFDCPDTEMQYAMQGAQTASVHALFIEVEASFGRFAFDCPNTEIQYTMHTAQTEMKIAFQIDLLIL